MVGLSLARVYQWVLIGMDTQTHWEKIYSEKAPEDVSWYREHLETFLELIELAASALAASIIDVGGAVFTFGPEGPTKCSGLDVVRYDAESMHKEFGVRFRLLESAEELHRTPFGTLQEFLYCLCRIE